MEFLVRKATPEDAVGILKARYTAIHRLGSQFYSHEVCSNWGSPMTAVQIEKFHKSVLNEGNVTFVAEFNSKILGFSRLSLPNTISAVYVDFDHMRFGIGTRLLEHLEKYALEHKIEVLTLSSSLSAEKFYLKHGYEAKERGLHTLSSGAAMEAVFMEKKIY